MIRWRGRRRRGAGNRRSCTCNLDCLGGSFFSTVAPHWLRPFGSRRNATMIAIPASGGDPRVLLEHRAAPRAQSWLFSHKTVNDAADIRDLTPAQPKHIPCTRHLLVLGAMILLGARICGADQEEHRDRGTPSRSGGKGACRREVGFLSHKKVPHCGCRHSSCTEIRSFPPCTEFRQKD
jgi:hypothetical protein